MTCWQTEARTAFSGAAADGNISSGMFVCNCISGVRLSLLWLLGVKYPMAALLPAYSSAPSVTEPYRCNNFKTRALLYKTIN